MGSLESKLGVASRNLAVATDSEKTSAVASDSDGSEWFADMARDLLGKDAGYALAKITGFPEGSCYKYCTDVAASRRMPPAFLLVTILRSRHGAQWLAAVMHGSDAEWWRDHQRHLRLAAAAERFKREID